MWGCNERDRSRSLQPQYSFSLKPDFHTNLWAIDR